MDISTINDLRMSLLRSKQPMTFSADQSLWLLNAAIERDRIIERGYHGMTPDNIAEKLASSEDPGQMLRDIDRGRATEMKFRLVKQTVHEVRNVIVSLILSVEAQMENVRDNQLRAAVYDATKAARRYTVLAENQFQEGSWFSHIIDDLRHSIQKKKAAIQIIESAAERIEHDEQGNETCHIEARPLTPTETREVIDALRIPAKAWETILGREAIPPD